MPYPGALLRLYALELTAASTHHLIIPCGRNTRPTHDPAPPPGAEGSGACTRFASHACGSTIQAGDVVEPSTTAEVAGTVGMESRPLGRLMSEAVVQARYVHRGGVKARRYTFELKEIISDILEEERYISSKIVL